MVYKLRKLLCYTIILSVLNTSFQPTYASPNSDKDIDIFSSSHPQRRINFTIKTPQMVEVDAVSKFVWNPLKALVGAVHQGTRYAIRHPLKALAMGLAFQKIPGVEAGDEFRVNENATGYQNYPSIALLNQTAHIVWEDSRVAGDYNVWKRSFFFNGSAAIPESIVNPITSNLQAGPSVAALDGKLVFTFDDCQTGDCDVSGIVLDPNEIATSNELFSVNMNKTGKQWYSRVKGLPDKNMVAAWLGDQEVSGTYKVYRGVFSPNGTAISPQPPLNQNTTGTLYRPSIAISNDTIAIAYDARSLSGDSDVYVRPLSFDNSPKDDEVPVNQNRTGDQHNPSIILLDDGYFVVWLGTQTGSPHIYGNILNSVWRTTRADFSINENMTATQSGPVLTRLGDLILVSWTDDRGIYQRLFSLDGEPLGPEFRINQNTVGIHRYSAVEGLPTGDAFSVWASDQDGTRDVWGRVLEAATLSSYLYPVSAPAPLPSPLPVPLAASVPSPKPAPAPVRAPAPLLAPASGLAPALVPSPVFTPSPQSARETGSLSFSELSTDMLTLSSVSLPFSSSSTVLMDSSSSLLELSTTTPSGRTAIIGGAVGGAAFLIIAVAVAILVKVFCCSGGEKKETPDSSSVDEEQVEESVVISSAPPPPTGPDRMTLTNVTKKVTNNLTDTQRKKEYVDLSGFDFPGSSKVVDDNEEAHKEETSSAGDKDDDPGYQYVELSSLKLE